MLKIGDLSLDLRKSEVRVRGKIIDLTVREFEVLKYLEIGRASCRERV